MTVECLDVNAEYTPDTDYWDKQFKDGTPCYLSAAYAINGVDESVPLFFGKLTEKPNYEHGKITFKVAVDWRKNWTFTVNPYFDDSLNVGDIIHGDSFGLIIFNGKLFDSYEFDGTECNYSGEIDSREARQLEIPIVGVNLGKLGFLTEIEPDRLNDSLKRLIHEDFYTEKRMMLKGEIVRKNGEIITARSLNDIVICRYGGMNMITLPVYVNGQFLHLYKGDGIIVTTPTGSSGYNLSAGGPIVEPSSDVMVLTSICSHSLNHASLILSADDVIEVRLPDTVQDDTKKVECSFDGCIRFMLEKGDTVKIRKSEKYTEFIKLDDLSFLETLHKKLGDA